MGNSKITRAVLVRVPNGLMPYLDAEVEQRRKQGESASWSSVIKDLVAQGLGLRLIPGPPGQPVAVVPRNLVPETREQRAARKRQRAHRQLPRTEAVVPTPAAEARA